MPSEVRTTAKAAEIDFAALGFKTVVLSGMVVDPNVLNLVTRENALRDRLFPFARRASTLQIAIEDPLTVDAVDRLAHQLGLSIESFVASGADITAAIEKSYAAPASSLDALLGVLAEGEGATRSSASVSSSEATTDAPIIKLVHSLIVEGIKRRASDIHLEPLEKRFRVRYRIDGILVEAEGPPKRLQLPVISRVKIMANISISEKRLPGDGRIQMVVGNRTLDLRVSSLPTIHGESIVMRILDKEGLKLGLAELGLLEDHQESFKSLITSPDGILLVTGPTGSGKTTTLYGCLNHINTSDRKIITVEDPVEYQMTGINQVPVRHEVGMSFASALRAMLRQAPNVIMIGEIRDLETAEIAINASLTGHMVFSTLHTNDAPGAVTRLIDLGVKPFLVSTALRAVMAQRLVRKTCEKCRKPVRSDSLFTNASVFAKPGLLATQSIHGERCQACDGTGFRGRIGIFEVLVVSEEIQQLIYSNSSSARLRQFARSTGMRTLREDGLRKAKAGLTTVEEVVSITVDDSS